jgi:hypothetical protein
VRVRLLIALVALGFFWAPVGLRMVGVTARPFENRRLATFPKPSQGWEALDQSTRFLVDRLPLREQAVQANTWISDTVFDTAPDYAREDEEDAPLPFAQDDEPAERQPDPAAPGEPAAGEDGAGQEAAGQPSVGVLEGRSGWLFMQDEGIRACGLFIKWPQAMRRWERLLSIIRRSGRRVGLVVSPDKTTMYPEYLPKTYVEEDCAPAGHRRAWAAIERARDPGIVGLRRDLEAAKHASPNALYMRKDTHWNTMAATIAVRETLERLSGRVGVRPEEIDKGRRRYTGDLTNLVGEPETDSTVDWVIRRPGLARAAAARQKLPGGETGKLLQRPAGGPPVLPGRTLFLYDSFGERMLGSLTPYARTLSLVQWYGAQGGLTPPSLIDAIGRSRTVILQTVERDLNFKASDDGFLTPAFLDQLERELPPRR